MLALLGMHFSKLSQTIIINECNKGAMRNATCTLCTTFATIEVVQYFISDCRWVFWVIKCNS